MYRCKVTSPGTGKVVGKPQPAKLCAGSSSTCVKGPKQPNVSLVQRIRSSANELVRLDGFVSLILIGRALS